MPANVWKRDVSGTPKQSQAQGASVASYKTATVAGGQASACDAPAAKRQHVQQHAAHPQHQQATQAAPAVAPPHQKGMFSKHEQPEGRAAGDSVSKCALHCMLLHQLLCDAVSFFMNARSALCMRAAGCADAFINSSKMKLTC